MNNTKNIKIILGISYLLIISIFLWFFFQNFSIQDFTTYDLIKTNRDKLDGIKDSNIILSSVIFFIGTVVWVLLLGFGSPVFLVYLLEQHCYIFLQTFFLKILLKKNSLVDFII